MVLQNIVHTQASGFQIGDESNKTAFLQENTNEQLVAGSTTTVYTGGTWKLNGFNQTIGGVTLRGGTVDSVGLLGFRGTLKLNGNVTVDAAQQSTLRTEVELKGFNTFNVADGAAAVDLLLDGTVTGATLRKTGAGVMRLTGEPLSFFDRSNTHGLTLVDQGTLELGKVAGTNAVGGGLTVGVAGNTVADSAIAKWLANDQMPATHTVTLDAGGLVALNGFTQTLANLTFASASGNSRLTTGAGTLTLTNKVSGTNAVGAINGSIDLNNSVIPFQTIQASDFTLTGRATNGTIAKSGTGNLTLASLTGNAILDAGGGTIRASNVNLAGLQGSSPVEITSGGVTVNTANAAVFTYAGALTGAGGLNKSGLGSLTLSGSTTSTFAGTTTVGLGTLVLSKSAGVKAIGGDLSVLSGAVVDVMGLEQFKSSTDASVAGRLKVHQTGQSLRSLSVTGGGVLEAAAGSTMFLSQGARFDGGTVEGNTRLTVLANGLQVTVGGNATVRGAITGASRIDGLSTLAVDVTGTGAGSTSALTFANQLHLEDNATVRLLLGAPSAPALIDVNGGLLVGAPVAIPFPSPFLAGMNGTAVIDLSGNAPLANGTYNLIDFSSAPYTQNGYSNSINPMLSNDPAFTNFTLISAPSTAGYLQISGNQLQYTVIPEPSALALAGIATLGILHRRRCSATSV